MGRKREYQDAAQKQWAYRQRKQKIEDAKSLDRCAFYSIKDELEKAGLIVPGESREDVLRVVQSLIERDGVGYRNGAVEMPRL